MKQNNDETETMILWQYRSLKGATCQYKLIFQVCGFFGPLRFTIQEEFIASKANLVCWLPVCTYLTTSLHGDTNRCIVSLLADAAENTHNSRPLSTYPPLLTWNPNIAQT